MKIMYQLINQWHGEKAQRRLSAQWLNDVMCESYRNWHGSAQWL